MTGVDQRDLLGPLVKQSGIERIERLQHGGQRIGRVGEGGGASAHAGNPAWVFGELTKRGSERRGTGGGQNAVVEPAATIRLAPKGAGDHIDDASRRGGDERTA